MKTTFFFVCIGKDNKKTFLDTCVICLYEKENPFSLKCNHSFCKGCITKHKKVDARCPLCRTDIEENVNIFFFLFLPYKLLLLLIYL